MSSKYLNGSYPSGYTLSGVYTSVTLGPSGSIGGAGLVGGTHAQYTIFNLGRIAASASLASGIELQSGGTVTNGGSSNTSAFIGGAAGGYPGGTGGFGICLAGGGGVANFGTVDGGAGGNGRFGLSGGGAG